VGEWRVDSVGLSRQVAFTSKPPRCPTLPQGPFWCVCSPLVAVRRKGVIEEALTETISTMQLACLVVNRYTSPPALLIHMHSRPSQEEPGDPNPHRRGEYLQW
jgi:hypothetical protein